MVMKSKLEFIVQANIELNIMEELLILYLKSLTLTKNLNLVKLNNIKVKIENLECNLVNKFGAKELAHVFRLPDRRMQMDYKESLTSIDIVETDIPKELQKGQIIIGISVSTISIEVKLSL